MKKRTKTRGNGTGCAYYSQKYRYWVAQVVVDWRYPEDETKPLIPIKKTKGGFLPGDASDKESICQRKRFRFDPWVGKIPWSRK